MAKLAIVKTEQVLSKTNVGEKSLKEKMLRAQRLFGLESSRLFHTPDYVPYAVIEVRNHFEIWPIRTEKFKLSLARLFLQTTGKLPCTAVIKKASEELEWLALLVGQKREVFVRLAKVDGAIYIDLVNSEWEQVKITGTGWEVIPCIESPVRFIRTPGMLELSRPVQGGSLQKLRDFLNVENKEAFALITSWLLGAMNPDGPFPILILHGVQGSSKSTTIKILRSCIDPSISISRSLPQSERDLQISASKSWVQSSDNISSLSQRMSDAFCRLSTGGGSASRKLYTNDSEVILNAMRPIILGGIPNFETQNDLVDRAIIVNLPHIPDEKRRPESEIKDAWKREMPGIFGALCDAVSAAIGNLGKVKLGTLPRMADFARFVVAAEPALPWNNGMFLKAYENNRAELVDIAIDADPVGTFVLEFMDKRDEWTGTHSELLESLKDIVPKSIQRIKEWPKSPNSLSNRLMKLEAFLMKKGVKIERRRRADKRIITLRKIDVEEKPNKTSNSDESSYDDTNHPEQSDIAQDDEVQLTEVSRYEVVGDYQGEPAKIIDKPVDREQGEI